MADQYAPLFDAAGKEWNVDPRLLRAVMLRESAGDPNAVSPKGATGLMQIMPSTGADLGVTDPRDPAQSIFGGAKYLSQQLDKYGNVPMALAAYNAGPGRVDAYLANRASLPAETMAYVPSVTARYAQARAVKPAAQNGEPSVATAPAPAIGLPSDADFLKMIGAGGTAAAPSSGGTVPVVTIKNPLDKPSSGAPGKGALPSDADFLKLIGATTPVAAPVVAPSNLIPDPNTGGLTAIGPAPAPTPYQPRVDLPVWAGGQGTVTEAPQPQQPGVLSHIGSAIASPFHDGPLGPDTSTGTLFNGPMGLVNRLLIAQPLALADAAGRAGLGLYRGAVAGGADLYRALGGTPTQAAQLERDLGGALPNALMPLAMGADAALRAPAPKAAPVNPLAAYVPIADRLQANIANDVRGPARGAYLLDKITTAVRDADKPPPETIAPDAAPAGAGPRSAGAAATPGALAQMSPAEIQAQRSTAETQKLVEPQPAGPDTNRYVPGVSPTEAHMVQNARTSRNEKLTASEMPQGFADRARENNEARLNFFDDMAGTPTLQKRLVDDRAAKAEADLAATWRNKQPADVTPLADLATDILNSPDGRRPLVRSAVDGVMKELTGPDGKPITDPELLYGVRKHIDDLIQGAKDSAAGTRAVAQLQQLKDGLDGVIEQAAPGFKDYLKNFSDASRPIDEMSILQAYKPKIVDSQNRITYSGVQRMMRDIVAARGGKGIDPAKSITDDTMNKLWALRDDLRRVASADELAKARGSDTAQNVMDFLKNSAPKGIAHIGANLISPGFGSVPVKMVTDRLRQRSVERAAERALNPKINRLQPPLD